MNKQMSEEQKLKEFDVFIAGVAAEYCAHKKTFDGVCESCERDLEAEGWEPAEVKEVS